MLHTLCASKAQALSARLGRPLVFFDIEHTGAKADQRGITEISCLVVTPGTLYVGLDTLINPGRGVTFNPFATRLTGITPNKVRNAPSWDNVASGFVLGHQDSVWIGFNSRASDARVIKAEHARLGLPAPNFRYQLDVTNLARFAKKGAGGLKALVQAHAPHALNGGHRAMSDVKMTLALFEALADAITDPFLANEQLVRIARKAKPAIREASADEAGLKPTLPVTSGERRHGFPWTDEERATVREAYDKGVSIPKIASTVRRSPFAVAIHLAKANRISLDEAKQYGSDVTMASPNRPKSDEEQCAHPPSKKQSAQD